MSLQGWSQALQAQDTLHAPWISLEMAILLMGLQATQLCFLHAISKGSQKSTHNIAINSQQPTEYKTSHHTLAGAAAQCCLLPAKTEASRDPQSITTLQGHSAAFRLLLTSPRCTKMLHSSETQMCAEKGKDKTSGARTLLLSQNLMDNQLIPAEEKSYS